MTPPGTGIPPPTRALAAAVLAAAAGSGTLETTLHGIVRAAVSHVLAGHGAMGVLSPDGRLERFVVVGVTPAEAERISVLPGVAGAGDGVDLVGGALLRVPVCVGESVFGHLYLTEKLSGDPFTAADVEVARALAAVAGLAIDNARLVELAERRRAWTQAGTDIATVLLSGADLATVLRSAAERVARLAGADVAAVLLPAEDEEDVLQIVAAVGGAAPAAEGLRLPLRDTRVVEAHRSGTSRLIDDVGAPRAPDATVSELVAAYGPAVVIPLGGAPARGTVVGLRALGREAFDPQVLDLAAAFATQTAVAMELARSHARERRLQLEADRDRIARDLHDHVVQRIFATALALDRIGRSLEAEAPDAAARIAERVDELDGTIDRIRTAIFALHEAEEAAPAAVRRRLAEVVRSVAEGHGLRSNLRVGTGEADLPPDLVPELVAVVRELVTNVVRHAGAGRLTVSVDVGAHARVVVTDDGRGIPPIVARSGLANLADRAERRRGRLAVSTGPSGTEVSWTVPVDPPG